VSPRRKNLFLVVHSPELNGDTFAQVAGDVERIAPHIRVRVIRDSRAREKRWGRIFRPALTVSMVPLERLRPLRGPVCAGVRMSKLEELARLAKADLPVPRWVLLEPDREPDLSGFGPYVVVKPTNGGRGAEVRIQRRGRVRYKPVTDDRGPRTAQEFIYTGRWPVSYRVTSLFGEVLFSLRSEASHDRVPLEGRELVGQAGGISIVATARTSTYTLNYDEEVLALGRRVAMAFPDIPLLGIDIVRDHDTGRLYVLETNPSGWVWNFSSEAGRGIQQDNGIDIDGQFGGLSIAAQTLARETDRRAR